MFYNVGHRSIFDKNNFISLTCVLEGELLCAPCPLIVKAKPTNSLWRKVMESTLKIKKNSKAYCERRFNHRAILLEATSYLYVIRKLRES